MKGRASAVLAFILVELHPHRAGGSAVSCTGGGAAGVSGGSCRYGYEWERWRQHYVLYNRGRGEAKRLRI